MVRRLGVSAGLVLIAILVTGAGNEPEPERGIDGVPERIAREALRERPTWKLLEELCETAPHRLSGSEGAARAVAWARRRMESLGLERVRLEPCTVPRWERGEVCSVDVTAPDGGSSERLTAIAIGGSVATPAEGLVAEVIEVRSLVELIRREREARGRIVFFAAPMDDSLVDPFRAYGGAAWQRVRGALEASKVGAVGVVVRSLTMSRDDVPHTGTLFYDDDVRPIPAAALSVLAAERLSARIASGEKVRLKLRLDCRWHEDVPSHNVVGELRGREKPDEIVVVAGHLDAWDVGQGAHDDGAGCCQAMAAAAILKRLKLVPRRTIRVVLYMNEENGTRGGKAYVREHEDELGRHVLALESDRGGFAARGFTTNAGPEALTALREMAEGLRPLGIGFVKRGGGGVDIGPLGASGVILVGYLPDGQRYFDVHHSEKDVLSAVNPRELELGTAAIASLVHAVADLPKPLPRNE